jgi:hypothetical protein
MCAHTAAGRRCPCRTAPHSGPCGALQGALLAAPLVGMHSGFACWRAQRRHPLHTRAHRAPAGGAAAGVWLQAAHVCEFLALEQRLVGAQQRCRTHGTLEQQPGPGKLHAARDRRARGQRQQQAAEAVWRHVQSVPHVCCVSVLLVPCIMCWGALLHRLLRRSTRRAPANTR